MRNTDQTVSPNGGEIVERTAHEAHPEQDGAASSVAILHPAKIVVLGMMSRWPVGGVAWVTIQYLEGLRRLGYDVYYAEAHGCTQTKFMRTPDDDGTALAAEYIDNIMKRFGFGDRWAYHDVHISKRCFGMSLEALNELYRNAALIINLHAGTEPLPEHTATGRLLYLETDPVEVQINLHNHDAKTDAFMQAHCAYYTWGLNYGQADCRLPMFDRFPYKTTCPLVVTDMWEGNSLQIADPAERRCFTTIGNWKQGYKEVLFNNETYHWSKHLEFMKFIDLPSATNQPLELALAAASIEQQDVEMLCQHGWGVRDGGEISNEMDAYQKYLLSSRGELSVAKDQNVRLRSGWFSERSAQYLAAGRPVIMQETGFSNVLPTGDGLFSFLNQDEIVEAIDEVNCDYDKHCKAALKLAREYFNYDVVLKPIMNDMGI